jgi:NAD(P)-dependent dehydrogenase (short-subunit alcohol dehydrogenase family)
MLERGSGRVIFTKTLAMETSFALARAGNLDGDAIGVTINAVTPGVIESGMTAGMPEKMLAHLLQEIMMPRLEQPAEVARVVCLLAAASRYISGRVWGVNGGYDM